MNETKACFYQLEWHPLAAFLAGLGAPSASVGNSSSLTLLAIGGGAVSAKAGFWPVRPRRGAAYSSCFKIGWPLCSSSTPAKLESHQLLYHLFFPWVTRLNISEPWLTLLLTALASAAYLLYLYPSLQAYEIGQEGTPACHPHSVLFSRSDGGNRFVVEIGSRSNAIRLAETLAETNRKLEQAQRRQRSELRAAGSDVCRVWLQIRSAGGDQGIARCCTRNSGESNPLASYYGLHFSEDKPRSSLYALSRILPVPCIPHSFRRKLLAVLDRALHFRFALRPRGCVGKRGTPVAGRFAAGAGESPLRACVRHLIQNHRCYGAARAEPSWGWPRG